MFNKNVFKKIVFLIICMWLIAAAGCSAPNQSETNPPVDAKKAEEVMNNFQNLVQSNAGMEEIAVYLAGNIASLSKEDASRLVDQFEQIQKDRISELETLFLKKPCKAK